MLPCSAWSSLDLPNLDKVSDSVLACFSNEAQYRVTNQIRGHLHIGVSKVWIKNCIVLLYLSLFAGWPIRSDVFYTYRSLKSMA